MRKKGLAVVLTLALIFTCSPITTFAKTGSDSTNGKINNHSTKGTLQLENSYALVSTSGSVVSDTYAEVTFTYGFGKQEYVVGNAGSRTNTAVSVRANSQHYGSVGISAFGAHEIHLSEGGSTYTWNGYTSVY